MQVMQLTAITITITIKVTQGTNSTTIITAMNMMQEVIQGTAITIITAMKLLQDKTITITMIKVATIVAKHITPAMCMNRIEERRSVHK